MDPSWRDPESPWWAKLRRAASHIHDVRLQLEEFERRQPWSFEVVPGPAGNESTYRLRIHHPVPSDLITAVGDAIHNMRSSLDAVAFELARRHVGDTMNATQETLTEFPIMPTGIAFESFFTASKKSSDGTKYVRRDMYGDARIKALRCAQPFAIREEAKERGIEWPRDRDVEYQQSPLRRLHVLSAIDKHRRLPALTWIPEIVYWNSKEDGDEYRWTPIRMSPVVFADGTEIARFSNPGGVTPPEATVIHQMQLAFDDDPGGRSSKFADTLASWHESISNWTIPRIISVAEGDPPPIGFTS